MKTVQPNPLELYIDYKAQSTSLYGQYCAHQGYTETSHPNSLGLHENYSAQFTRFTWKLVTPIH